MEDGLMRALDAIEGVTSSGWFTHVWFEVVGMVSMLGSGFVTLFGPFGSGFLLGGALVYVLKSNWFRKWVDRFEEAAEANGW